MNAIVFLLSSIMSFGINNSTETRKNVSYENYLKGTEWKCSDVPFESEEVGQYSFEKFVADGQMHWGNFIQFEENTFSTYYRAPCGNDCFTSVNGDYRFIGENLIKIKVTSISYSGFCGKENVDGLQFVANYSLSRSADDLKIEVQKADQLSRIRAMNQK